jgi:hypothetical protein
MAVEKLSTKKEAFKSSSKMKDLCILQDNFCLQ